ncbi:putative nicotinate-nucleotide adenylyltransferase [Lactococcus hodotermopsidis]|uniref:Probable nicotinate-nucleotide adenylyltransferase n=1 Tax=Pseudolactococcus hodotermopsidis TaxID=2709157 RepID=A0A6A0BD74_9LACT|nr:nicotinate-nicotinamide nucleotide adenylyltransferase [Lactococcus hodotermopsidis]GFH43379.1 putative nicotinate-nucleotide adenylyltransferase [Lactococcus hodotermopsidis]
MGIELLTPYTKVELEPLKSGNRRQIGLFVGKFAPIHVAHLVIADQVRRELNLERVLFMPEYDDENATIVSMLVRALQGNSGFGIETTRLNSAQPLSETLRTLSENNPDTDFYFIAGSDVIGGLSQLENAGELTKLVQLVGVQRPRFRTGTSLPIIWIDVPQMDVSSKNLRKMLQTGIEPKFLIPDVVLEFIKERGLYGF